MGFLFIFSKINLSFCLYKHTHVQNNGIDEHNKLWQTNKAFFYTKQEDFIRISLMLVNA